MLLRLSVTLWMGWGEKGVGDGTDFQNMGLNVIARAASARVDCISNSEVATAG